MFYIAGGLLEVQPHIITVLADYAENAANLDEMATIRARDAARQAYLDCLTDLECAKVLIEATAQLQAIDHLRRRARHLVK